MAKWRSLEGRCIFRPPVQHRRGNLCPQLAGLSDWPPAGSGHPYLSGRPWSRCTVTDICCCRLCHRRRPAQRSRGRRIRHLTGRMAAKDPAGPPGCRSPRCTHTYSPSHRRRSHSPAAAQHTLVPGTVAGSRCQARSSRSPEDFCTVAVQFQSGKRIYHRPLLPLPCTQSVAAGRSLSLLSTP